MKFNNILVVYAEKETGDHLNCINDVRKILEGRQVEFICARDLNKENFVNKELVIVIGGDGTFIRSAFYVEDEFIIGINSEPEFSEGAFASLDNLELEKLNEILDGNFEVIKRERLEVTMNEEFLGKLALNEVYVGAHKQFHTSRYKIILEGEEEEHRSSGVLIATSAGSNAWYKSAGGLPFNDSNLRFIVREPFMSRIFKPKILHGHVRDKISFLSTMHNGGAVILDSNHVYDFNHGDAIEVKKSEKVLNVLEAIK